MLTETLQGILSKLSPKEFAEYIDNTLLKVDTSIDVVLSYVEDTRRRGFKCLVLSPYHALYLLSNGLAEGINLCGVIGFPMGFCTTKIKVLEAEELLVKGVKEIDVVMNIQAFKSGRYDDVFGDLVAIVDMAKRYGSIVKVIIESPLLTYDEKAKAVDLVVKSGAHYVKTSTGVLSKTDFDDIHALVKLAKGRIKVKAAGGFRHAVEVLMAIAMGVDRIGTSTASQIYREFLDLREKLLGNFV
ncbi:MAG: deoxyribose-phosphate aldolase [Ignisphaera sp.]|uniref:Deoxyribose-phosphate aldolase n=1 Tax=Ignisphaera aggregans TaxID=334771 RepID=A0A7C4JKM3_9CREN